MGALEEMLGGLMGGEGGLAELTELLNRLDEGIRWLAHEMQDERESKEFHHPDICWPPARNVNPDACPVVFAAMMQVAEEGLDLEDAFEGMMD